MRFEESEIRRIHPLRAHLPKHYYNQTPPHPDHVLDKDALEGTNIFPGAAVAEWSKALLEEEKINENQKNSALPPGLGNLNKALRSATMAP